MKISVLVPTYRRSKDLERCLNALKLQSLPADEVLVVVRDTDEETHQFLGNFTVSSLPLKIVDVIVPGQVAALNAGLAAAVGDIISITDDDAAPHGHWLETIRQHFISDPLIGGVGGRDWLYLDGVLQDASKHPGASNIVGKIQWFGRPIGNHHIGTGMPRTVDILKGANMSYRRSAIQGLVFDTRLKGQGAQADNDMAFSLAVSKAGWKLIYDPKTSVDHYLGARADDDKRNAFNPVSLENSSYNQTFIMLNHTKGLQKILFLIWTLLFGTRQSYGFFQVIRMIPHEGKISLKKLSCALAGKIRGFATWLKLSAN
jgi:GT2 family glycosyltransferase